MQPMKSPVCIDKLLCDSQQPEIKKFSANQKRGMFTNKIFFDSESTNCSEKPDLQDINFLKNSFDRYEVDNEVDDVISMSSDGEFLEDQDLFNLDIGIYPNHARIENKCLTQDLH